MGKNEPTSIETETRADGNSPKNFVAKRRNKIAIILGIGLAVLACVLDRCHCGNCETGTSTISATDNRTEKEKPKTTNALAKNNPTDQKSRAKKKCPSPKSYYKNWTNSSGDLIQISPHEPHPCLEDQAIFDGVIMDLGH